MQHQDGLALTSCCKKHRAGELFATLRGSILFVPHA